MVALGVEEKTLKTQMLFFGKTQKKLRAARWFHLFDCDCAAKAALISTDLYSQNVRTNKNTYHGTLDHIYTGSSYATILYCKSFYATINCVRKYNKAPSFSSRFDLPLHLPPDLIYSTKSGKNYHFSRNTI
eukprot:GEMP01032173.1.p1 GENE.GEMP01032173.1~~GEMP01032173.1.p1  ORF type:complete len:131 (+),score=4.02 GEMP01032173.1:1509-1901(+)